MQESVVNLARNLLGKRLVTDINGETTTGIISETEAYAGITDRASHAWNGRRTKRTETMYSEGGHAYVYLCYGIHRLFNVVTNREGIPHAILIRGIIPEAGIEIISARRKRVVGSKTGIGPGNVTQCLGIELTHNATDLCHSPEIWIEDTGLAIPDADMETTPRIGIAYAKEDALLPYRFVWNPA
ncbi:MAG: DNA-3-methyladenine glycosylase [Bacteroidetes bacterium]|nr:DNA-3-methyladenine glycosylase [Bacteroidota bacterium]